MDKLHFEMKLNQINCRKIKKSRIKYCLNENSYKGNFKSIYFKNQQIYHSYHL